MPDHRHKSGDEHAGGRKPGGKKPRPDGPRGEGPRGEGPPAERHGAEGPRGERPRPDGTRFEGPKSFGPRPDGQRASDFGGPRPGGPRPGGPRRTSEGFGQGGPGGFSGPRPGGFSGPRPTYGGRRQGGAEYAGPRPGAPEGRPEDRASAQPRFPGREWQPNDSSTPRPSRPFGHSGPRPDYGGPRPDYGGPRPTYGGPRPTYGGPRPGDAGPRPERGGFGFGEHRPESAPRPAPAERDFEELPPEAAGPETAGPAPADSAAPADFSESAESAEPAEFSEPAVRRPGPPRRPDYRARSGGYPDRRQFRPGPASTAGWSRPPALPPSADLLGEDEEIVAGRHPVEEAFIAHRKAIRLLVVPQRRQALEKLVLHATNLRIPIVEVEGGTLTSLAGFDGHQGIALVTDRRQFAGLDDLLARAIERKEASFVIVLDSLEDPQNFGSLLRTAEACGVHGVVYPTHRQAPLSAAAIKASAGAVEHLLLVPVDDLAEALTDLHVRGLRIIGSDADAPLTARQADLRGPVAIVVGSEGQGLGPAVRRRCDTVVRIPMRGHLSSLNASVAGSILLYEASSQRAGDRPLVAPAAAETAPLDPAAELAPDLAPEPAADLAPAPLAEPAAKTAPATRSVEAGPRRRATARKSSVQPSPAPAGDELLPGGPAVNPGGAAVEPAAPSVDPDGLQAAPPEAGSGRA